MASANLTAPDLGALADPDLDWPQRALLSGMGKPISLMYWPLRAPKGDASVLTSPPTVVSAGLETQLSGSLRCQVALCYGSTETLLGVLVGSLEAPIALVVEGHALEDVCTMVIAQ